MTESTYYMRKRKAMQLCVCCGKQDAYTLNGRALCFECCEKRRKYYNERQSRYSVAQQQKYRRNKSEGVCIRCGKEKAVEGLILREKCRIKEKWSKKRYRSKHPGMSYDDALYLGLCTKCRHEPPLEGQKLCAKCYEDAVRGCDIMHEINRTKGNQNHYWRGLNELIFQKKTDNTERNEDNGSQDQCKEAEKKDSETLGMHKPPEHIR